MIYISRIKYQKELHSINKPLNCLLFSPNQFICNNYNIIKANSCHSINKRSFNVTSGSNNVRIAFNHK